MGPDNMLAVIGECSQWRYSLNWEAGKCKNVHMELGAVQGRDAACVCMLVCVYVCREGQISAGGGVALCIFHSWHISLGGARQCDKKAVRLGSCDAPRVIVSLVAWNESSVWPFLKWQDRNNPPLPLTRKCPSTNTV